MLFNSIAFICVFLPVIFILYYLLPGKIKDIALVAGGAVFFAWGAPVNLVVLAFFILFNYAVGIQMEGYMRRRRSTEQLFAGSILINMIVYVFFAFIGQRVGFISEVPVGIGICILQVLSYLIEIHRGNVKAQKSILDFAVYIAMFPLFLAGPVVKYPQIRKELKTRKLSWAKAGEGIALFVCGFAKKVIIADYLADSFTKIMSLKAGELSVFGAWLGCAIFMFQIYFAFSGYCDMAVGLCRMLGFDVKKNFRYPYVARNITTFVRRFNSSGVSVEMVRTFKALGAKIHAEATPHHFTLTDEALLTYGTLAKMNPPLRTAKDRQQIIEGLADGTIDLIATDHAPHSMEEKNKPLTEAPSGITGLETSLALGITSLVRPGHLTLLQLLEKMTVNPAKLYHLPYGQIKEGAAADLVIFDPEECWKPGDYASKSCNTPFTGQELFGKVKYTICGGKTVYSDK